MHLMLRLLCLVLLCCLTIACTMDERQAVPIVVVEVLDGADAYTIDGRRVTREQLQHELQSVATETRNGRSGTSRVWVRVHQSAQADYSRVDEVVNTCIRLGMDKVEAPSAR